MRTRNIYPFVLMLFSSVAVAEDEAERESQMGISRQIIVAKETTPADGAFENLMPSLRRLRSQFVPFANVSVEYSVELEKSGKWEFYSKHQLKQNSKNLFFKEQSLRVDFKEEKKEFLFYREIAWDGAFTKIFTSSFWFKDNFEIKESYGKQPGIGSIMSGSASSFSSFLSFYDIESPFFCSIYDAIGGVGKKDDIVLELKGTVATVTFKNKGLQIVFDIRSGALLKRIRGVYVEEEGVFEKQEEFDIKKAAMIEGRQVPVEFIWTHYEDKKRYRRKKIIAKPETIKFNISEDDFDLTIKFPVGTSVSNSIENTSYTVSELDGEGDLTNAKQTLDALFEKANKGDKLE